METLRCSKCGEQKAPNLFSKAPKSVNRQGRASWCRKCSNKHTEAWRRANPDYVRAKGLRYRAAHKEEQRVRNKKYRESHPGLGTWYRLGISFKEKMKCFEKQGRVCAICACTTPGRKKEGESFKKETAWCADHDHKTGKFRGVLCWRCNWLLGHAEDSTALLKKAIDYLKQNGSARSS